jgi:hypothetical protein
MIESLLLRTTSYGNLVARSQLPEVLNSAMKCQPFHPNEKYMYGDEMPHKERQDMKREK